METIYPTTDSNCKILCHLLAVRPEKNLEVNLSASSIHYRVIIAQNSQPKNSWHLDDVDQVKCMNMFQRCKDDPQYKVRTFYGTQLQAEDYLRLGCTEWLNDSAIEAFFNTMIMKSTHSTDRRFIIIGSQHWNFAQSEDDAELHRMKR